MVPDILLPHQSEERSSESSTNNTSVENPTMVPTSTGTPGGLSLEDFPTIRLDINDSGAAISDVTGSTPVDRLAYLSYPTHHEEFLRRVQTSCLHHGGTKLTQIMVPCSLNGLADVSRGVEIPLQDL